MPAPAFPCLQTSTYLAWIADNAALGIHRAGYNGVAAFVPRRTGNNLFVPTYAGLNYETISLTGLAPYADQRGSKFEPRCEAMRVEETSAQRVVLVQPETSHAHVSARITFEPREPCYLDQRIELVFHRRFCADGESSQFRSLWASYLHMPRDRHVYLRPAAAGDDLAGWVGITRESHGAPEYQVRPLPAGHELSAGQHLQAMADTAPLDAQRVTPRDWAPQELPVDLDGPLPFYYGLCDDDLLFLMMFRQPDAFRLAYSPSGGGREPAWCPAWDYVLGADDAELGRTYTWDLRLAVKDYEGRADVLDEVRRYARAAAD